MASILRVPLGAITQPAKSTLQSLSSPFYFIQPSALPLSPPLTSYESKLPTRAVCHPGLCSVEEGGNFGFWKRLLSWPGLCLKTIKMEQLLRLGRSISWWRIFSTLLCQICVYLLPSLELPQILLFFFLMEERRWVSCGKLWYLKIYIWYKRFHRGQNSINYCAKNILEALLMSIYSLHSKLWVKLISSISFWAPLRNGDYWTSLKLQILSSIPLVLPIPNRNAWVHSSSASSISKCPVSSSVCFPRKVLVGIRVSIFLNIFSFDV